MTFVWNEIFLFTVELRRLVVYSVGHQKYWVSPYRVKDAIGYATHKHRLVCYPIQWPEFWCTQGPSSVLSAEVLTLLVFLISRALLSVKDWGEGLSPMYCMPRNAQIYYFRKK